MSSPQPGVRVGVPWTTTLCTSSYQPRQFEYHYSQPAMCIGTINGEVLLADWQRNQILGRQPLPQAKVPFTDPASVLALAWLHQSPRLIAGCSTGHAAMYTVKQWEDPSFEEELDVDFNLAPSSSSTSTTKQQPSSSAITSSSSPSSPPTHPSLLSEPISYRDPLTSQMTSLHCNSTDTLLCASGYTLHVNVMDLETGQQLRKMRNIHTGHINIARFANHMPYLLLTSSFDKSLKMFDIRSNERVRTTGLDPADHMNFHNTTWTPKPIYTCESLSGNVMVTFSPTDLYFLSSAVDNEVRQYTVVDGRLHLEYEIPKQNLSTNYTRSYYCNEGEAIISGSSASDLLYMCSSVDGTIIDTVAMNEGRKDDYLYVQSLRGCPMPQHHNRCTLLVCYRKQPLSSSYEMVEVNLNRDSAGSTREHPLSLSSIIDVSNDYRAAMHSSYAPDVVISCQGAVGEQLIYAHQALLQARWPWFAKHVTWSREAQLVRDETIAAAAAAAAAASASTTPLAASTTPVAKNTAAELGSLDEDENLEEVGSPMSTGDFPQSMPPINDAPLIFCKITVPHPTTNNSTASSTSFDTITISSAGMVALEFPALSRAHCLYLLEYLYSSVISIQSEEAALASTAHSRAQAEAQKIAALSQARKNHDFEALIDARKAIERKMQEEEEAENNRAQEAARTVSMKSSSSASAATKASSELKGLDEDDDDDCLAEAGGSAFQNALLSSLSGMCRSTSAASAASSCAYSATSNAAAAAAANLSNDIHSVLVQMSLRQQQGVNVSHSNYQQSPLSGAFSAKLALMVLASSQWYNLPRLANILERSMRKQFRLWLDAAEMELEATAKEKLGSQHHLLPLPSSATTPITTNNSSNHSSFSRSPALQVFFDRLESCVKLGAVGLVKVAQDYIERAFDWIQFNQPWFIHELAKLFPESDAAMDDDKSACQNNNNTNNFLSKLQHRRTASLSVDIDLPLMQSAFVTITGGPPSCPTLVLWNGGSMVKTAAPAEVLHVLNGRTLRLMKLETKSHQRYATVETLITHASGIVSYKGGQQLLLVNFGGQSDTLEDKFHVLDLNNFVWSEKEMDVRPRARKKHTMTAVPSLNRLYIFGGRDAHHVFGDTHYVDARDPAQWRCVNVNEMHTSQGRSSLAAPAVRYGHSLTYAPSAGGLILFGGTGVAGCRNDVWILDPHTNIWECKIPNDPSCLQGTPEQYELAVSTGEVLPRIPLPRFGHCSAIIVVDGQEHLAIMGGLTTFQVGQTVQNDLWLLDTSTWEWKKIVTKNIVPKLPTPNLDLDDDPAIVAAELEREEVEIPSRRFEFHGFIVPYEDETNASTSSSSSGNSSRNKHRANGRLVVVGGTTIRAAVKTLDVFDFDTMQWERVRAHPSSLEPQPTINIQNQGCLWEDMQQRFQQSQPQAFAAPVVLDPELNTFSPFVETLFANNNVTAAPASSSFPSSSITPATTTMCAASPMPMSSPIAPYAFSGSIDACIEHNLNLQRALYPSPTPLPLSSFVHFLVEGRLITVPKLVLSARSNTFLSMLKSNIRDEQLRQRNLIVIEGVRYIIFRCLLYFLYCGDILFEFDWSDPEKHRFVDQSIHSTLLLPPPAPLHPHSSVPSATAVAVSASNNIAPVHKLRASSSSSTSSSPVSSSANSEKKRKKEDSPPPVGSTGDELSDSEDLLSLSALQMAEMERVISAGGGAAKLSSATTGNSSSCSGSCNNSSKKSKNGHHTSNEVATSVQAISIPDMSLTDGATASSSTSYVIDPLELLVCADRFNLSSLGAVLEIGLSRQIDVAVVCKFLYFAEIYHLSMLHQLCTVFIVQHYEEITTNSGPIAAEYAKLPDTTRRHIEDCLHRLAGSHRGERSRGEPNPLLVRRANSFRPPRSPTQMLMNATAAAAGGIGNHHHDDDDEEDDEEDFEDEEGDFFEDDEDMPDD